MWQGFLNLNKDAGMTSHDCVGAVRRLLKEKRVGHGGTLDPMATGVLPLAVGNMTRLLPYLQEGKGYRATVRLGVQTNTDDLEGEIIRQESAAHLTLTQVRTALSQFIGTIEQTPPQYSAIRQGGKHLYELARAGVVVAVPPRQVEIYTITVVNWQTGEFPEVVLDVTCGGGTYLRALARDLGTALGSCGTLAGLMRTRSGGFDLSQSLTLEEVRLALETSTFKLQSPVGVLNHLPLAQLDEDGAQALCFGQRVTWFGASGLMQVWQKDQFLGIARCEKQRLQPVTILGSPV